jgi:hypothetical protein
VYDADSVEYPERREVTVTVADDDATVTSPVGEIVAAPEVEVTDHVYAASWLVTCTVNPIPEAVAEPNSGVNPPVTATDVLAEPDK